MIALVVLLCIAVGALLTVYLRERAHRRQRPLIGEWPIATVSPAEIDPIFRPGPFGPGRDTEVAFIGKGPFTVEGGTTDAEAWILAGLYWLQGSIGELLGGLGQVLALAPIPAILALAAVGLFWPKATIQE